jgi:hypothetical protein
MTDHRTHNICPVHTRFTDWCDCVRCDRELNAESRRAVEPSTPRCTCAMRCAKKIERRIAMPRARRDTSSSTATRPPPPHEANEASGHQLPGGASSAGAAQVEGQRELRKIESRISFALLFCLVHSEYVRLDCVAPVLPSAYALVLCGHARPSTGSHRRSGALRCVGGARGVEQ